MRNKRDQNEELMIILNMLQNWIRIWRWKLSSNVGDKNFWEEHEDSKERMCNVYRNVLSKSQEYLPDFKVANAVIHFDEASPHMHVVGVPVWSGTKKGLSKKVSKRNVFTPSTLSVVLQDKLREEARSCFKFNIHEIIGDKKKGRNHDLSVADYKVQQEIQNL